MSKIKDLAEVIDVAESQEEEPTQEQLSAIQVEQVKDLLVKNDEIILTVSITDKQQADELLRWLYSEDKPMTSQLIGISWGVIPVPTKEAQLLQTIREVMSDDKVTEQEEVVTDE